MAQNPTHKTYRFKLNKKNTEFICSLLRKQQAQDISFYLDFVFELIANIHSYPSKTNCPCDNDYLLMLSEIINIEKYNKPLQRLNLSELRKFVNYISLLHFSYNAYLLSTIYPEYINEGLSNDEALDKLFERIGFK